MIIGPIEQKKALYRAALLERREDISEEERAFASRSICAKIASSDLFQQARILLCYAPIGAELDISPLFAPILEAGKFLAFPRCEGDDLRFYFVNHPQRMAAGRFHIPEPGADAPIVMDFSEALCLVPALAADQEGYRLGYGKGFYDRFLKEHREMQTMLPIYDALLMKQLPRSQWDVRVNLIVTEQREWSNNEA